MKQDLFSKLSLHYATSSSLVLTSLLCGLLVTPKTMALELGANWTLNIFTDIQLNWQDDDHDEMSMADHDHDEMSMADHDHMDDDPMGDMHMEDSHTMHHNVNDFELGETVLFVQGQATDRLSFLGDFNIQPKKYRDDHHSTKVFQVARLQAKYQVSNHHSILVGKMHTPVNYWNDNFHHGTIFYPTISRPLAFEEFVPHHEIAVRWAGENFGQKRWFYDVILGSGQSAENDPFTNGIRAFALIGGFHPSQRSQIRLAYYEDTILNHEDDPNHTNHAMDGMDGVVEERLHYEYDTYAASFHHESDKFRVLTEIFLTDSDEDGLKKTWYQYLGWKAKPLVTPYLQGDWVSVPSDEIHYQPGHNRLYVIGADFSIHPQISIKAEFFKQDNDRVDEPYERNGLQVKLSVVL